MRQRRTELLVVAFLAAGVERNRHVWLIRQNILDQIGQHAARAEFNEQIAPRRLYIFDLFAELYRVEDMIAQCTTDRRRVFAIGLSAGVGINRHTRLSELCLTDGMGERLLRVPDQRRMEGRTHRDRHHVVTSGGQALFGLRKAVFFTGDDHLFLRVDVRQMHTF